MFQFTSKFVVYNNGPSVLEVEDAYFQVQVFILSNMLMLLRQRKLLIPNPNLMRPSVVVAVIT